MITLEERSFLFDLSEKVVACVELIISMLMFRYKSHTKVNRIQTHVLVILHFMVTATGEMNTILLNTGDSVVNTAVAWILLKLFEL